MTKFTFTFYNENGTEIATKIFPFEDAAVNAFNELTEEQKNTFKQAMISIAERYFEVCPDEIDEIKDDPIYEAFFYDGMVDDWADKKERDCEFNPLLVCQKIEVNENREEDSDAILADFYAVQERVDGFGYDTLTCAIFKTREEALEYTKNWKCEYRIVPQWWGEYENYYN